jgi:hypothetical protein
VRNYCIGVGVCKDEVVELKRIPLRILLPIAAAVFFIVLCFAATQQAHVIDIEGWRHSSDKNVSWGTEPVDIGSPADILLLALNLPALIALFPLLPLTYWIESEIALRIAWGLATVGQWFLIGRYFDTRRGPLSADKPSHSVLFKKAVFYVTMVAGAAALGLGLFSASQGHSSFWAMGMDVVFVFWGLVFMISALRWRSSSSWAPDHFDSLRLP